MGYRKHLAIYAYLKEARIAIEKEVNQKHADKKPRERQKIQDRHVDLLWTRLVKQNRAQNWRALIIHINIPIWFAIMETIRRMTGTEDGMLDLAMKSLPSLTSTQTPAPSTMDAWVPMEPSLASEGMLWFDDLMIPDPFYMLPWVVTGMLYIMFSTRRGTVGRCPLPGGETQARSYNDWMKKKQNLGALAVAPATFMFPSAMLLYWFSSTLAAVAVGYLPYLWGMLPRICFIRVRKSLGKGKPGEDKQNPKPKMQEFRGPTMEDLRSQKQKKKK